MVPTPQKSIDAILEVVQQQVKKADIRLGTDPKNRIRKLPFGIPPLDAILGGGLPYGRITLIKGDYSSGKTLLCQKAFQAAQIRGLTCAYIDVEKALDPEWFKTTGVDLESLIVAQPSSGEEAFDLAIALVQAGTDLIVMDSGAALVPTAEIEEDMDQHYVAILARLINKGLRKLVVENKDKSIFILLNQLRSGPGIGPIPVEALPGGKGQWFYSTIVLDIRRGPWIKESEGGVEKRIGFNIRVRVDKNKIAPPQGTTELPFIFEGGVIDTVRGAFEVAVDSGVIQHSGAIYKHSSFPEKKIRGKLNVLAFLKENEGALQQIQEEIQHGTHVNEGAPETNTDSGE